MRAEAELEEPCGQFVVLLVGGVRVLGDRPVGHLAGESGLIFGGGCVSLARGRNQKRDGGAGDEVGEGRVLKLVHALGEEAHRCGPSGSALDQLAVREAELGHAVAQTGLFSRAHGRTARQ